MNRKVCTPTPVELPYFPNCKQEFARQCADQSDSVIKSIPAGTIWTQGSAQLANQQALRLVRGRARATLLECNCYNAVGDTDSGSTYFSISNCPDNTVVRACDTLCFYSSYPELATALSNGVLEFNGSTSIRLVILESLCNLTGTNFCPFDPNVIQVELFDLEEDDTSVLLFDSTVSYCLFFDLTHTPSAGVHQFYFLFTYTDLTTERVYISFENGTFVDNGLTSIGPENLNKFCMAINPRASSCEFCTPFNGFSPVAPYLQAALGEFGLGQYIQLFDEDTTLKFAFKPWECRSGDLSIPDMQTRYCGAQFTLLFTSLADFVEGYLGDAVTIFESADVPLSCNCETLSFEVELPGPYVIIFNDLNSGFQCIAALSHIAALADNPDYTSIAADCLPATSNYYLACFDLKAQTCLEQAETFWMTSFVGDDTSERTFACDTCDDLIPPQAIYRYPYCLRAYIYEGCTLGVDTITIGLDPVVTKIRRNAGTSIGAGFPPATSNVYPFTLYDEEVNPFLQSHFLDLTPNTWAPNATDLLSAHDAVVAFAGAGYPDEFYTIFVVEVFKWECDTNTEPTDVRDFKGFFSGLAGQSLGARAAFVASFMGMGLAFTILDASAVDVTNDVTGSPTPTFTSGIISTIIDWIAANEQDFEDWDIIFPMDSLNVPRLGCGEEGYRVNGYVTNVPQNI